MNEFLFSLQVFLIHLSQVNKRVSYIFKWSWLRFCKKWTKIIIYRSRLWRVFF